jgi:predicted ATP-binding protein involved in virulence
MNWAFFVFFPVLIITFYKYCKSLDDNIKLRLELLRLRLELKAKCNELQSFKLECRCSTDVEIDFDNEGKILIRKNGEPKDDRFTAAH